MPRKYTNPGRGLSPQHTDAIMTGLRSTYRAWNRTELPDNIVATMDRMTLVQMFREFVELAVEVADEVDADEDDFRLAFNVVERSRIDADLYWNSFLAVLFEPDLLVMLRLFSGPITVGEAIPYAVPCMAALEFDVEHAKSILRSSVRMFEYLLIISSPAMLLLAHVWHKLAGRARALGHSRKRFDHDCRVSRLNMDAGVIMTLPAGFVANCIRRLHVEKRAT